jgi:DNA-directed RNA polymerase II subunit RPB2
LPSNEVPNGMNVIVAISCYGGYNQEDSVLLNRGSIERGLFGYTFYRTYKDDEKKIQSSGQEEKFTKPDKNFTKGMKPGVYDKLNTNGFVDINTYVDSNDIIIGKVMPIKNKDKNEKHIYKDSSTFLRNNESGFIDQIYTNRNGEGHKFCKVRIRSVRTPKIGDKFSSRHGQKGTCGMIINEEDMPFTKDGIRPDIIVNPHAIPSRMTIAQLIECIMGKASTLVGCYGDGTPFMNTTVESISKVLEQHNFDETGNEVLYNGFNGKQMESKIFIGPTYYQRLKHMVADKIHSRSTGPMVLLTRQPAEGRARDGGLRFGEMERDCMIAHGSVQFLKERIIDVSDNYRVFTCNTCGLFGSVNPDKDIYKCNNCNNYIDFSEVRIPYACKLLIQELSSMCIAPRIKVK